MTENSNCEVQRASSNSEVKYSITYALPNEEKVRKRYSIGTLYEVRDAIKILTKLGYTFFTISVDE